MTAALRHNVCLMVDAEHTYFQPVGGQCVELVYGTKLWISSTYAVGCRCCWCFASWWTWSTHSPVRGAVVLVLVPQVPAAGMGQLCWPRGTCVSSTATCGPNTVSLLRIWCCSGGCSHLSTHNHVHGMLLFRPCSTLCHY